MLNLSKYERKRKKGIAIATAQLLFHIDHDVDPNQDIKGFINILMNKTESVATAYGWTSGSELAQLILQEGLDTGEVKLRLLKYKNKSRLADKRRHNDIKNSVISYLSNYCQRSKTYEGLIDQVQYFPDFKYKYLDSGVDIDRENIIDIMKTFDEKDRMYILKNVNAEIDRRDAGYSLGDELEKYLNDIGQEYGIESYIDEFEVDGKNYFSFKIFIGNRGILSSFNGTFNELKTALAGVVRSESENKVTCPFCGRKIVRYVAMNKIKNCECGAEIVITPYMVRKRGVIYSRTRISFRKPD
ncbi:MULTISPECIES: hypothetical protein [Acidiplasma]|uniref:Uncharacterized protein n=1 Tax=Acidiplasma cupricumulans TaxID=312540 RepID=A0A0Q0WFR9_9ARCH|nr:hypothetical protein [Acidiplasma cupricumulans]KQB34224.1 hypothetical protein AOG55_01250 [Acidiplasma cupricumulans]